MIKEKKELVSYLKARCGSVDRWFNTRQAIESGMINFIKQGMQRYNLSFHAYLWSKHKREVEQQYNRKIVRSSFYTKYKNIFEE